LGKILATPSEIPSIILMEKCMFMLNFSRDALLQRQGYGKFISIPHKVEYGF